MVVVPPVVVEPVAVIAPMVVPMIAPIIADVVAVVVSPIAPLIPIGDAVRSVMRPIAGLPSLTSTALTGTYAGAAPGTSLQVQRRQGTTWTNFSTVTASVNAGQFSTWIETGQPGPNRFRMFDAGASKASNIVVVQIG